MRRLVLLLALSHLAMGAESVTLAPLFSDHAVLQRGLAVPIWGTAEAGTAISVEFAGQQLTTTAGADRTWRVWLAPLAASSEPHDLVIRAGGSLVERHDVLVGEVWLCSGQSNMGMQVRDCADAGREVAAAEHPLLRLFTVDEHPALVPRSGTMGSWSVCSPGTVGTFSGTAYFFGRSLLQELRVPIGLLHASVGGTPAESWTSPEALASVTLFAGRARQDLAAYLAQPEAQRRFPGERQDWEEAHHVLPPAIADAARGWAEPLLATRDWRDVVLPSAWGNLGFTSGGVFWLRKEIELPASAAGKPFWLKLNWMNEQYDIAYWNGCGIGHGGDQAPDHYFAQRSYLVPASQVHAGRNVIAVRITSATQWAGVWQWGSQLEVPVADPETVDDHWLVKQESAFAPLDEAALKSRPKLASIPFRLVPSSLYHGMIAPLLTYGIRGAIWYQGENNANRPGDYRQLLTLMITDWRSRWGQGDFPFLIQQLVNNGSLPKDADQPANWAFLREAQQQVADSVANAGIAIGTDLGSRTTIHPTNKQEVGRRLALVALEKTYGRASESSGPRYAAMTVAGGAIRLSFAHAKGLAAAGDRLQRFAVAGSDRRFVWADARIDGDTVTVASAQVPQPVAVRYAWAENPQGCNLVNATGLPAAPFRTDAW